jgi:hypothetical protein
VIGVLPAGFRYMTPADVYLLLEPQVAANYRAMQTAAAATRLSMPSAGSSPEST